jgi:predicted nucleic acid-binding protein
LASRLDADLPFVSHKPTGGPELLLDTCVYIDVLQGRVPAAVRSLLTVRLCNHSGIALAELTHLFGRLDPRDTRTATVLRQLSGVVADMPQHRLSAPSERVLGEAGILAGLVARLASVELPQGHALLNDAVLYLQAAEQGQMLLTRNIREFDWFDQLLPGGRAIFYHRA